MIRNVAPSTGRFLVVEDDKSIVASLCRKLAKLGWQVDSAFDGEQALAAMKGNSYDAVLLDLMMPIKDGFAVLTERAVTKNAFTPIYVMTSLPEDKADLALALGARRVFSKMYQTFAEIVVEVQNDLHGQK